MKSCQCPGPHGYFIARFMRGEGCRGQEVNVYKIDLKDMSHISK